MATLQAQEVGLDHKFLFQAIKHNIPTTDEKERVFRRLQTLREEIAKLNIQDWEAERSAAMREKFGHNLDM